MKRMLWAATITAAIVMTGCDSNAKKDDAAVEATPTDGATEATTAAGPAVAPPATTAEPAAPDAPAFAVIYPGGQPKSAAISAQGPAGPGGMLDFTTDATPDEVVAFYRQRAEAAGLKPINSLNRGEARAYSAGDGGTRLLTVVVTPVDGAPNDVQLSWTGGH
jgi:outer membrane murein-binding lipoprotein Lpp